MNIIGLIGIAGILLLALLLVPRYFPNEVAKFLGRLGAPSEASIKKQSGEMLAAMDRNLANRKAKQRQ